MANDTRLRTTNIDRDPREEWPQKPSTRGQLEELRAKVNQLEYGGITADKLGGGTISTQNIELAEDASLYSGSSTADGFVLDKDGLRFYNGGVNTIDLRADGGTAKFTGDISASTITGGTFQTATTGKRVKISSAAANRIDFFSGHGSEATPGAVVGDSFSDVLYVGVDSPRAGNDWVSTSWYGRSAAGVEAQFVINLLDSANADLGTLIVGSRNGSPGGGSYLSFAGATDVLFGISTGFVTLARPSATNALQMRFQSIPAGGTTQVALGVDHGVVANELIVHAYDGTTPLPISASAFNVISSMEGKKDIKGRPQNALAKVKQLRPVEYTRSGHKLEQVEGDGPELGFASDKHYVGFLAEEMMTQFPEAVVRDIEGNPRSIDLMAVVAILTQAIQELAA